MNYDSFTTFSVQIEHAVAWVTIDYPPVNIHGLPMLADLNNLARKLEADNTVGGSCFSRLTRKSSSPMLTPTS